MEDNNHLALDEALIARKVRAEQHRVFNDRTVASVFVSPLGIGLLAWMMYLVAGWQHALLWSGLMVCVELLMLWAGAKVARVPPGEEADSPWMQVQVVATALMGLAWGSSTWFIWVPGQFLFYITDLCVLVGVSFICMVVMAPHPRASLLFSAGLLLPPLAQMAVIDNPIGMQIGVGWVVMLAVQVRYSGDLRRELLRELDSSVRNVALLEMLSTTSRELFAVNTKLEAKNTELHLAMERLNQLVTFDQLTGAHSRRFIFEQLERQVALSARHGNPASLIMFDLDHFKSINDRFGHPVGDMALREATKTVGAQLREGDMLARIGGEEFLVLLPMTRIDDAVQLAERLRQTLADTTIHTAGQDIALPASFGVAELQSGEDFTVWFRRVDAALYDAKDKGRNRLVTAQ